MTNHEIILETERLLFRPHLTADVEDYCAMEMDADFRRYVGGKPRTREEAEHRFKVALKPVTNRLSMWATVYKAKDSYIGRCGIYPHFNNDGGVIGGEASLGLYIAKAYWGMGFATEAGLAFIKFGFDELKIKKIVTMVDIRNEASARVIKKLGFVLSKTEIARRSFYHFELQPGNELN
ncbi:MAG TPA: GNAT family N-acetyltransferase [Mucilaginibacter sp.]|jgi:RimJ/RimL family protein N-acetyltransferase